MHHLSGGLGAADLRMKIILAIKETFWKNNEMSSPPGMFPTYEDDRNEEADPVGFLYCHIIPRGKK